MRPAALPRLLALVAQRLAACSGTGLVRGLIAALANKVDLINMSYGEPTALADKGRCVPGQRPAPLRER